jgi:hypothetical protein
MPAHDAHDHPGNDARQVLKDGCPECEFRGAQPLVAIRHMDPQTFRRALARAITWQTQRNYTDLIGIPSDAESAVLETIWCVLSAARASEVERFSLVSPLRSEWGGTL